MDKEVVETNIQSDIFYYKRKAQKLYLDHLLERAANEIISIVFEKNEANQAKSIANIPGISAKITLQSLLLDHKMRAIFKSHPQYAQMERFINEYERALDVRAKTEIQSIYLKQTFDNLDFLKKTDPNAQFTDRRSQQQ